MAHQVADLPSSPDHSRPALERVPSSPVHSHPALERVPSSPDHSRPALELVPSSPDHSHPALETVRQTSVVPGPKLSCLRFQCNHRARNPSFWIAMGGATARHTPCVHRLLTAGRTPFVHRLLTAGRTPFVPPLPLTSHRPVLAAARYSPAPLQAAASQPLAARVLPPSSRLQMQTPSAVPSRRSAAYARGKWPSRRSAASSPTHRCHLPSLSSPTRPTLPSPPSRPVVCLHLFLLPRRCRRLCHSADSTRGERRILVSPRQSPMAFRLHPLFAKISRPTSRRALR